MNTDGTGFHTCKECHKTESLWNHTTTDHKEGEHLEDRRSVGASSCNSGDGTDQRIQSLMFMIMIIIIIIIIVHILGSQCAYRTNDLVSYVGLKMTDWWVETCSLMYWLKKGSSDVYNSFYYILIPITLPSRNFSHSYRAPWYYQSFIYSPTHALVSCLKKQY